MDNNVEAFLAEVAEKSRKRRSSSPEEDERKNKLRRIIRGEESADIVKKYDETPPRSPIKCRPIYKIHNMQPSLRKYTDNLVSTFGFANTVFISCYELSDDFCERQNKNPDFNWYAVCITDHSEHMMYVRHVGFQKKSEDKYIDNIVVIDALYSYSYSDTDCLGTIKEYKGMYFCEKKAFTRTELVYRSKNSDLYEFYKYTGLDKACKIRYSHEN